MEKEIENQVNVQDILIKGLMDEIVRSVNDYLKKNYIEKNDIEINVGIIESENPCIMKVQTTLYRRSEWKYQKKDSEKI